MMESWQYALDRYLTNPPEQDVSRFVCDGDGCCTVFYPNDTYYELEGMCLCEECAKEWLEQQAKTATEDDCYD